MTPQEAFKAGALPWKLEAQLSTHRNFCPYCQDLTDFVNGGCIFSRALREHIEEAKKRMMEVAKELGVETL